MGAKPCEHQGWYGCLGKSRISSQPRSWQAGIPCEMACTPISQEPPFERLRPCLGCSPCIYQQPMPSTKGCAKTWGGSFPTVHAGHLSNAGKCVYRPIGASVQKPQVLFISKAFVSRILPSFLVSCKGSSGFQSNGNLANCPNRIASTARQRDCALEPAQSSPPQHRRHHRTYVCVSVLRSHTGLLHGLQLTVCQVQQSFVTKSCLLLVAWAI